MKKYHTPVLIQEVVEGLRITPGKKYIDATLGGGGHTERILRAGGKVLGIDVDQEAIEYVQEKFKIQNSKFKIGKDVILVRGNFREIKRITGEYGFERVSGIVFDLGVSSHQLEEGERGFSFLHDGTLDMRMDKTLPVTAADLVNGLTEKELYELFTKLGEESRARAISQAIIQSRRIEPIATTLELAGIVQKVKGRIGHIHPATQVFQALRIAVNSELENLRESIMQSIDLLAQNGRVAVISFHSLEDRIIKQLFKEFEKNHFGTIIAKKPIIPTHEEIEENPRSRSSKLRIFEKAINSNLKQGPTL